MKALVFLALLAAPAAAAQTIEVAPLPPPSPSFRSAPAAGEPRLGGAVPPPAADDGTLDQSAAARSGPTEGAPGADDAAGTQDETRTGALDGRFKAAPPPVYGPPMPGAMTRRPQSDLHSTAGARIRLLDKLSGRVEDFALADGETVETGRLRIELRDCRRPPEDEADDAVAFLQIEDLGGQTPEMAFSGWMFASSPALSAMDHARYDVWVLSCITDSAGASGGSAAKSG